MYCGFQILIEIVMGLLGGVVSGIIASKIIEKLRLPPNIFICHQIAKCKDGKYRIKIINDSKEDAFDISFFIRLVDPITDMRFVIMGSTIPILRGCISIDRKEQENVSGIYPQLINKQKIEMLPQDAVIRKKYEEGTLTVLDFCRKNTDDVIVPLIDIVITAKNAKSGRAMTFVRTLTEIKEGEWNVGERSVYSQRKSRSDA